MNERIKSLLAQLRVELELPKHAQITFSDEKALIIVNGSVFGAAVIKVLGDCKHSYIIDMEHDDVRCGRCGSPIDPSWLKKITGKIPDLEIGE